MTSGTVTLSSLLKAQKYSVTVPRKAVFEVLSKVEACSMNELVKQLPAIDRASVYRSIELFETLGIVDRIQIGWKYKLELSDMFRDHHHHAICNTCAKTFPLTEDSRLEKQIHDLVAGLNFQVTTHTLELRGLCGSCSKA